MTLASHLECPELSPAEPGQEPDLVIESRACGRELAETESDGFNFYVDGVARYKVCAGRSILVAPEPGADPRDVRLFLLGKAMAAALHQRGRLPLHVSAIEIGGEIHAFCGDSGAGKSTLVAALQRRGLKLFCDDVGLVDLSETGDVRLFSGVSRVKLWRDALEHFGIDTAPLQRDISRADKFHLPIEGRPESMPLRALYVLEKAGSDQPASVDRLSRQQTIGLLLQNTYRPKLQRRLSDSGSHLQRCTQVASAIEGWRYSRPWRLTDIEASLGPLLDRLGWT